jgi:predicted metal-dependent peptidase
MEINSPSERIKTIITEFIFKDSYWGFLFSKLNRVSDERLPSIMGVCPEIDGSISLIYNPIMVNLSNNEFLSAVIEHEGMHILDKHIPRLLRIVYNEVDNNIKRKKTEKWNKAADCAVNTIINIKKEYKIGPFEIKLQHPDNYNLPGKKTAEFYYTNIPDDKEKQGNGKGSGNGSESKDGTNIGEGDSKENPNLDDHGSWMKNATKVSDLGSLAARVQQYTESIVEESYNQVRKKGDLPSYISQLIDQLLRPPQIPYYQLITKLIKGSRLSKYKRAYTRINKKRVYTFFIDKKNLPAISPFPGKTKDYSFNISILLDTSRSMSIDDILEGLSGVKNIIENDKDCKTTVIENDAAIEKEYEIKRLKDIQFNIKGRGGTCLYPGLHRCKELNTDVTVVFTDGAIDNINIINKKLIPRRIIWVLTKYGSSECIDRSGYIVRLPK